MTIGKITLASVYVYKEGVSPNSSQWYTPEEENTVKKMMRLLSMLLGISGIGMFFLASIFSLNIVWAIGIVTLIVGAVIGLVSAFIEGNKVDKIGSYLIPRL